MPMSESVIFETRPAESGKLVAIARLNSPRTLNSLSLDMIEQLHRQLCEWGDDAEIACVWLEGEGEKAFCAGGDIVQMYHSMTPVGERNLFTEEYFAKEYRLDYLIHVFEKPVICWASGIVMGGGMGLMQGASHRVVTEKSRLAMPEISIGLFPDVGGSWFLNRAPGKTGLFLGLTGVHFNAADALFAGLADVCVHADKKQQVLDALLQLSLTGHEESDNVLIHRLLREMALTETLVSPIREHLDCINDVCDRATLPEVGEALEQVKGVDDWMRKAVSGFERGSAQTAWLVWEQLRRARHLSLADVFRMEWCMSTQCAMHADLREGVRALLIDKNQPTFRFSHVGDVPRGDIEEFFRSPADHHPLADL